MTKLIDDFRKFLRKATKNYDHRTFTLIIFAVLSRTTNLIVVFIGNINNCLDMWNTKGWMAICPLLSETFSCRK